MLQEIGCWLLVLIVAGWLVGTPFTSVVRACGVAVPLKLDRAVGVDREALGCVDPRLAEDGDGEADLGAGGGERGEVDGLAVLGGGDADDDVRRGRHQEPRLERLDRRGGGEAKPWMI